MLYILQKEIKVIETDCSFQTEARGTLGKLHLDHMILLVLDIRTVAL